MSKEKRNGSWAGRLAEELLKSESMTKENADDHRSVFTVLALHGNGMDCRKLGKIGGEFLRLLAARKKEEEQDG